MKKITLLSAFAASGLVILGCHFYQVVGSGNPVANTYFIDGFDAVAFSHGCEATFEQADSFSVEVTIDDNLEEYVLVKNEDGKLTIGLESGHSYRTTLFSARVRAPYFRLVEGSGGSSVVASGTVVLSGPFAVDLSGGSEMKASASTGDLNIRLSGGSRLTLSGSGQNLKLCVSGGGETNMFGFEVNDCNVTLSGGSSVRINASGVISGELSGGSDLDYCGNASLGSVQKSGGSTVERRCP